MQWLSSGVVVDWNGEFHMMPVAGLEDQERAEVPYLSPDDIDCVEATRVAESRDFSDTNAADDGDYLEYKYGHYGRNAGSNSDVNPTPASSADDVSHDDNSTQADDPNNADDTAIADANKSDDDLAQARKRMRCRTTKSRPRTRTSPMAQTTTQATMGPTSTQA